MIVNHKYVSTSFNHHILTLLFLFFFSLAFFFRSCTWRRLEDRYFRNTNNMSVIWNVDVSHTHTQTIEHESLILSSLTSWVQNIHRMTRDVDIFFLYLVSVKHQCISNLCHRLDIFYLFIKYLSRDQIIIQCVRMHALKICLK